MAYKRQWHSSSWDRNSKPGTVTLSWNSLVGAYDLKFENAYGDEKWGKVKGIIAWIKQTIPYGERDYDDVTKVWTIHEKYFTLLREIIQAVGSEFTVTVVERPAGGPAIKFTPLDTYFTIFKNAAGVDITAYSEDQFSQARKIYFKTAMRIHPDKGGDPATMRDFNEAWDIIKERHFKIQRVMEQTL
jgi:hypothetical protein